MRVRVSYIWDSETNSYYPDDGTEKFEASVTASRDDRLHWDWRTEGRHSATGKMPLTRGFEILPYLAGLARDVVTNVVAARK